MAVTEKIVLTLGERWGVSHHVGPFREKPGSVPSQRELGVGVKYMQEPLLCLTVQEQKRQNKQFRIGQLLGSF